MSSLKFMPHTWMAARRILLNAKKIVFINKGLQDDLMRHPAIRGIASEIESRFMLIPNGIDDYNLDHIVHKQRTGHNIVFVGQFSARKNVVRLAKAVMN